MITFLLCVICLIVGFGAGAVWHILYWAKRANKLFKDPSVMENFRKFDQRLKQNGNTETPQSDTQAD